MPVVILIGALLAVAARRAHANVQREREYTRSVYAAQRAMLDGAIAVSEGISELHQATRRALGLEPDHLNPEIGVTTSHNGGCW